ncbi:MAG: ATPase domain-containing protein [Bradyrhizobium sp.]|jgi:circadian clock protein KaiC
MSSVEKSVAKAKTGVSGLDDVLAGGFSRGHLFLVEGASGTGKTTIARQFLLESVKAGEKCLWITLRSKPTPLLEGQAS